MPKPKRDQDKIVAAGLAVMYAKGYNATGMQDLATANGMTKGSLYAYFRNKEDFAVQALSRYTDDLVPFLQDKLLTGDKPVLNRLKSLWLGWAQTLFTEQDGCGCFAGNMSQEMSGRSEALRDAAKLSFDALQAVYQECLEQAKAAGELSADTDTVKLSEFLYNGWQGALVRAKAEREPRALEEFVAFVFAKIL